MFMKKIKMLKNILLISLLIICILSCKKKEDEAININNDSNYISNSENIYHKTYTNVVKIKGKNKNYNIFEAIKNGNLKRVQELIREGEDVNQICDIDESLEYELGGECGEYTPLIFAIWCRDLDIIKYLLDNGADPFNICYDYYFDGDWNAFLWACGRGNIDTIKLLAEFDTNLINSVDQYGRDGIFVANIFRNNIEVIEYLVKDLGIDINNKDINGNTLLDYYKERYNYDEYEYEIVAKLKELGAKSDGIFEAIENGNLKRVQELIREGIDINSIKPYYGDEYTLLIFAVWCRDLDIIKYLLDNGADPFEKAHLDNLGSGCNAFLWACGRGNIDTIKMLAEFDTNLINSVDEYENNGLFAAFRCNNIEVFEYLVKDLGIDINNKDIYGKTLLGLYEEEYQYDEYDYKIIAKLKELGAKNYGIFEAIENGNLKRVQELVREGEDINQIYTGGTLYNEFIDYTFYVKNATPLVFAVFYRDLGIMKYLLDNGANPFVENDDGENAFLWACGYGNIDTIKMLAEFDPDLVYSESIYNVNGLHIAVLYNSIEVIEYLVKDLGIDINSKNKYGDGVLYYARIRYNNGRANEALIEKLKELGAAE